MMMVIIAALPELHQVSKVTADLTMRSGSVVRLLDIRWRQVSGSAASAAAFQHGRTGASFSVAELAEDSPSSNLCDFGTLKVLFSHSI